MGRPQFNCDVYLAQARIQITFWIFPLPEKYPTIHLITHSTSIPGEPIDWNRSDIKLESPDTEPLYPSNIIADGYDFITT